MNKANYLLLLLFFTSSAYAQMNSYSKEYSKIWDNCKVRTLEVAKAMPEEKYNWQPTKEVMSFGQQMAHIANSMRSMEHRFLKNQRWNSDEPNASKMSKQEIVSLLEEAFEETMGTINNLEEEDLTKKGKDFGNPPLNKRQSISFMFDHITNHRAKAVLYLRINGIVPPRYGYN